MTDKLTDRPTNHLTHSMAQSPSWKLIVTQ